ncbi:L-rhamnose mutarotase [Bombilactobacillus folatiphilus]|uniref:L-rhamnose mutarotase n=1 Tax=Bombilactobacillus folatiphilus TaxID=2923362 RepID=A0ABY4P8N9_9LACO|nr:L-rhamnose mutarotase [Bombilactobacillus folatiphilus]UQS82078.1 L-rhamnose mutarotase [Bombilactobacillus folatiphilus]
MTKRLAQLMHVYPDQYEEYERRHNNLFPEMKQALLDAGAHNYSIFLDKKTGNLFAYLEVDNYEKYQQIAQSPACQKWWAYMEPLMETNSDQSPVTVDLHEVFHL